MSSFPTDKELCKAMLKGDERAFRAFFESFFPRVYRFALPRLNGDVEATKDVVQTTLTNAIRNLESYRGDAALFSWLCQICRNQITDHARAQRRHADTVLIEDSGELRAAFEAIAAPAHSQPEHRYSNVETRRMVQAVLDKLPERYGDILEWKYIQGWSVEEIGNQLGIGHVAAQSLLARARIAFREALEVVFGSTARDLLDSLVEGPGQ